MQGDAKINFKKTPKIIRRNMGNPKTRHFLKRIKKDQKHESMIYPL